MLAGLVSAALAAAGPAPVAELEAQCHGKDGWSDPAPPVRIHGQTYYVGTCGISAILVASPQGHILIDGATAEAAPLIAANIERLGFRLPDVKLILASHEHHDHVGGIAELQRLTGATVRASPAATVALSKGRISQVDPQFGLPNDFAPVVTGKPFRDGDILAVGPTKLRALITPGHALGGTSWTWQSCEAKKCVQIVYADSLTAVSADGYRFTDHPERQASLWASIYKIRKQECDLLVTPHPSASALFDRLAGRSPLIDRKGCAVYAARGAKGLEVRLAKEAAAAKP